MTARYNVLLTAPAQRDERDIQLYIVGSQGHDAADNWEEKFYNHFLIELSKYPHQKIVAPPVPPFLLAVRQSLFHPTKSGVAYTVLFTVEEFPKPNPEPLTDYFSGIVRIVGIRHASSMPLTEEELNLRR
jgi:plasmid stabilization system protein ParE